MSGIIAGTRVATTMGWCDVAALHVGAKVLTFDNGVQEVTGIVRRALWSGAGPCPAHFWPLAVPAGAIGNASAMRILPRQGVMIENDLADTVWGDPFVLMAAQALDGLGGIERSLPSGPVEVLSLRFASDQVVFAEAGALLFCLAEQDLVQLAAGHGAVPGPGYRMVPDSCARSLLRGDADGVEWAHAWPVESVPGANASHQVGAERIL